MPTYEYACEACGHHFDEFQSITAPHLTDCPVCKKSALKRLFGTGGGLIFKGTGFYQTDYKSSSHKQDAQLDRTKRAAKEVKASQAPASSGDSGGSSSTSSASGSTGGTSST